MRKRRRVAGRGDCGAGYTPDKARERRKLDRARRRIQQMRRRAVRGKMHESSPGRERFDRRLRSSRCKPGEGEDWQRRVRSRNRTAEMQRALVPAGGDRRQLRACPERQLRPSGQSLNLDANGSAIHRAPSARTCSTSSVTTRQPAAPSAAARVDFPASCAPTNPIAPLPICTALA